jgi:predicted Zn-dependent protease
VQGYTSRETAGLFGLSPARVRAMARAGILTPNRGPRREYRFGFQDLVLLRSARTLLDASVPRRRVHRALRQLVRQLPAGRSASQVRLMVEGTTIVAHDGDAVWRTEDGQLVMDFVAPGSVTVEPLVPPGAAGSDGEGWYQHGLDLEPFDVPGAKQAYREAMERNPSHAGAHVNYGRLVQQASPATAIEHYRLALEADPGHATAAFNLGTALEATGQVADAIAAYRQSLSLNPALADAHYNLSLLYQQTGHKLASLVHLKRYRELTS